MQNINASQVVFIGIAATACAALLFGIFKGTVVFEAKDFMVLAGGAFGYFFAYKPTPANTQDPNQIAGK